MRGPIRAPGGYLGTTSSVISVQEAIDRLGLECLAHGAQQQVLGGYTSDLLSDVIAGAEEGTLWITVQRHLNIVAVAQLKKVAGIVLTKGAEPDPQVVEKAREEGIYLFRTPLSAFEISGKLYQLLHR